MTNSPMRVGIVGANVETSWAAFAHIPALKALDGYLVSAVCTTRRESADAAAGALNAQAFLDAGELARSSQVDLVAVSVKVPDHFAAVMPALEAGKPVYCEWPLGRTTAEAQAMADLARAKGVRTLVGLQAHAALELEYVRELLAHGYVGEVTSVAFLGAYPFWGEVLSLPHQADESQGINLLTIPGGHTLDALDFILGDELAFVQAVMESKRAQARVRATGEIVSFNAPDHLAVIGAYRKGAVFSANFLGGAVCPPTSRVEIDGSRGRLILEMDGLIENAPIRIKGWRAEGAAWETLVPPANTTALPDGPALNVGLMYARFAAGDATLPDFDRAVRVHQVLDAIRQAAKTGARVIIR